MKTFGCLIGVALVLLRPLVAFAFGAASGWLASNVLVFVGGWIVSALLLVGLKVEAADLPLIIGLFALVGSFFRGTTPSIK